VGEKIAKQSLRLCVKMKKFRIQENFGLGLIEKFKRPIGAGNDAAILQRPQRGFR
jgi:hypothetical protein